jgi:hypothetical protein
VGVGSDWQPCGQHLIGEFASARGVELATQKAPDLGRLGVELLGQVVHVVAVPRELLRNLEL